MRRSASTHMMWNFSFTITTLRRSLAILITTTCLVVILLGIWISLASVQEYLPIPIPKLSINFKTPRPSVTLRQGTYTGTNNPTKYPQPMEQFRGIPYGLSTAGERRFAAPLPITTTSNEVIDASKYGYRCPFSTDDAPGAKTQDEDCLNVNIDRPQSRPTKKLLPVLIHFYGGSFNFGAGDARQLNNLVGYSAEPFIGVSFNYRVGALGFLSSILGESEGLLNAGLKDQILLLEWVRDNIADFGGDPDDVTIMGNSAGAHGMGHHILRNTKKNTLFHKAIIESGGATARACYTPSNPIHEQQFKEFLSLLSLQNVPESEVIGKLRGLSFKAIKDASESIFNKYNPSVRWPWQPVIDGPGGVIPTRPIDLMRSGDWLKIPILTGFNTNEGSMFVPVGTATSEEFTDFFRTLLPSLTEADLKELDVAYPDPALNASSKFAEDRVGLGLGIKPQYKRLEQAYGHFAYVAPVKQQLHYSLDGGARAYLYHFAVNGSVKGGADHGTHVSYPTYNDDVRGSFKTIAKVAGSMHAYWTSFIVTGDPNKVKGSKFKDRPEWPAYERGNGKLVVFGEGNDERAGGKSEGTAVKVGDDKWMEEECGYWWARTEKFEV